MTDVPDIRPYLDDVIENLRLAREFTGTLSAEELAEDQRTLYAVVRALEIVGEATKQIPREVRALVPEVPWAAMAGMRDRLIHGYRDVDPTLVWKTATAATVEAEAGVRRCSTSWMRRVRREASPDYS